MLLYIQLYILVVYNKKEDTRDAFVDSGGTISLIKMRWNRQEGRERTEGQKRGNYVLLYRMRRELTCERSEGGHQNTR